MRGVEERRKVWTPAQLPGAVAFAAIGGVALRLALIWTGWCDNDVIADDAFYYFSIARNAVAGHGFSFDGIHPTNGFHPLYLISLLPVFKVSAWLHLGPWAPVHLSLTLCTLLDLGTGILLYRLLFMLGYPRGAVWAATAWLISPMTLLLSLRGLEGSLNACVYALLSLAAASWLGAGFPGSRKAAALGALFGLGLLARTDNILMVGPAILVQALLCARTFRPPARRVARAALAFGACAAAAVLPWLAWTEARFGSPVQVSGLVKLSSRSLYGHYLWPASGPGRVFAAARRVCGWLWTPAVFVTGEEFSPRRWAPALFGLLVVLLVLTARPAIREIRDPGRSRARLILAGFLTYLLAHVAFYGFVVQSYTTWYASVPAFILTAWLAGMAADPALQPVPARARAWIAAAGIVASLAVMAHFFRVTGVAPGGPEKRLALWFSELRERAPAVRSIGIANGGRPGYFAPFYGPFRIVNLDCLVNNEGFQAWRSGRYLAYVESNVDLLVLDEPATLDTWMSSAQVREVTREYPRWPDIKSFYGPRVRGRP